MPPQTRIFEAIVWVGHSRGQRLTLEAKDYDEVTVYLREKFGPDAVFTVSNEEDANAFGKACDRVVVQKVRRPTGRCSSGTPHASVRR